MPSNNKNEQQLKTEPKPAADKRQVVVGVSGTVYDRYTLLPV